MLSHCPFCRNLIRHSKLQNNKWDFYTLKAHWNLSLACVEWMARMREGWTWKTNATPTPTTISSFFYSVMLYSNNDPPQKQFEEYLTLFVTKELMLLSFVEAPFFWRLVLKQNLHFNFPSRWVLIIEILFKITKKMKEIYIALALESCKYLHNKFWFMDV